MMTMKLALKNVRKSYKDYSIYFLTLMFSVCLFYSFNSFHAQKEVMELSEAQSTVLQTVSLLMNVLSVFVAIVLAFLVLYANNFLIKRRKKEFGIYMLLGMPKHKISKILICETMFIGILSLVLGLLLGIMCSQGLSILTASIFDAAVDYHVVFSYSSMMMTIASFAIIFLIVMAFNTRIITKVKLIHLLHTKKKIEKQRLVKPWISIILFILSLTCLGVAYYFTSGSLITFGAMLVPIIILGSIGTVLFFISLSGFLLQFIRKSKKLYYRGLNLFVLRQINAKVNSTSLSMSVVCLLLLLSIGALSTGLTLNSTLTIAVEAQTPYMFTYMQDEKIDDVNMQQLLALQQEPVKEWNKINFYENDAKIESIMPYIKKNQEAFFGGANLQYIKMSDYKKIADKESLPIPTVKANEGFFISTKEKIIDAIQEIKTKTISVGNYEVGLQPVVDQEIYLSTFNDYMLALVIPDDCLSEVTLAQTFWNVNFNDENKAASYQTKVENNFTSYAKQHQMDYSYSGVTRQEVYETFLGMGMLFTYIGMYLGIVFLMASAVILALQQLSEAEDSRENYQVLQKIGASKHMRNKAILYQIGIYFLMPLGLAIVHSFVGVPAVSSGFSQVFGLSNMTKDAFLTALIILVIYGAYFSITYTGYKTILQKK